MQVRFPFLRSQRAVVGAGLLTLLWTAGCGSDQQASPTPDVQAGADAGTDAGTGTDVVAGTDAGTGTDAEAATDTVAGTDAEAATDAGTGTDAVAGTDAEAATDAVATTDATAETDSAVGSDAAEVPFGLLTVADQVLEPPFKTVLIKSAAMPKGFGAAGKVRVYLDNGGVPGALAGEAVVPDGKESLELPVTLQNAVVATQQLHVALVYTSGTGVNGEDGAPLVSSIQVTGDTVDPALAVASQMLPTDDLQTVNVAFARVPARFANGLWLAVYADNAGVPGAVLGKVHLDPGDHTDATVALTSQPTKGQLLHALYRTPAAGTGSWVPSGAVIADLSGAPVTAQFSIDSEAFQPVLEIEDQTLTNTKKLLVKAVTIPLEYAGGGWVGIYADNDGQPGELQGKQYFSKGAKVNQTVTLDIAQEGQKTLHAVLYGGQLWADAQQNVLLAPGGAELRFQFQVGAGDLSYILAQPYVTKDPRHVMVTRAYSYHKPAWVVLARDDGTGKPGLELARKKVLPKFAGNVHLHALYGDFLQSGTVAEYLTAQPGTFRRYAKGEETLHVLLFEDDPADNAFTFTPTGAEDLPVLDANNQPVTAKLNVKVQSSILNSQQDSPRYYFPCPLSQHVGNPTKLPVDCRCHVDIVGLDFPECKADIADGLGMTIGEGPRARTQNFGGFRSGFTDVAGKELIGLLVWKDNTTVWPENDITIDVGAVVGIHTETRKRRLISGRYNDPQLGIIDIGTGPVLSDPFEVQLGPDGQYYVASYGYVRIDASLVPTVDIIRVDPTTGNRSYVWRSNHLGFNLGNQPNPYGHCANGRDAKYGYASVQVGRKAFGIDATGNFYLSYAHNGNTPESDGIGIIQVSANGSQCSFVTRTKVGANNVLYKGQVIGSGPEPQAGPYKGMLVKDGKLYTTTELNDELYEVDIATGDRKVLHKEGVTDNNNGSSGTHVLWDGFRNLIWQGGLSGSTLLFDPTTGTTEPLWCPQNFRDYKGIACLKPAAWGNNGLPMERGMWLHPTDPDLMFVVNYSMIVRVDLKAGTSEIFSY